MFIKMEKINNLNNWKNVIHRSRKRYAAWALAATLMSLSISCKSPEEKAIDKQIKETEQSIKDINEDLRWNPSSIESLKNEMQIHYNAYVRAATYYESNKSAINDKYAKIPLEKTKKDALNEKKAYLKLLKKFMKKTQTAIEEWINPNSLDPTDLDTVNQIVQNFY